jgi:hypothetical protein
MVRQLGSSVLCSSWVKGEILGRSRVYLGVLAWREVTSSLSPFSIPRCKILRSPPFRFDDREAGAQGVDHRYVVASFIRLKSSQYEVNVRMPGVFHVDRVFLRV